MPERPVLTACWSDLLLLNFSVPVEVIARLAPAGTEPDLHEGNAYISIVGFHFHTTRLFGVPVPGHTRFPEINLRFYVRRLLGGEARRGVVFVREIAPRRAVAVAAKWLYNENYITRPMRTRTCMAGAELRPGDTLEYAWGTRCSRPLSARLRKLQGWNRLAACVAGQLGLPRAGSLEEALIENYWGYGVDRDGATWEYQVAHEPWRVAPVESVIWECDVPATYDEPLAEYLAAKPAHAMVAAGSAIKLYRGRRLRH